MRRAAAITSIRALYDVVSCASVKRRRNTAPRRRGWEGARDEASRLFHLHGNPAGSWRATLRDDTAHPMFSVWTDHRSWNHKRRHRVGGGGDNPVCGPKLGLKLGCRQHQRLSPIRIRILPTVDVLNTWRITAPCASPNDSSCKGRQVIPTSERASAQPGSQVNLSHGNPPGVLLPWTAAVQERGLIMYLPRAQALWRNFSCSEALEVFVVGRHEAERLSCRRWRRYMADNKDNRGCRLMGTTGGN